MLLAIVAIMPVLARVRVKFHGSNGADWENFWVWLVVAVCLGIFMTIVRCLFEWLGNFGKHRCAPGFKVGMKCSTIVLPCPQGRKFITVDSDIKRYEIIVEKEMPSGIETYTTLALCPGLTLDTVQSDSNELNGLGMIKLVFDHSVDRCKLDEIFEDIKEKYAEKDAELEGVAQTYKGINELGVSRCVRQLQSTASLLRTTLSVRGGHQTEGFFTELKAEKYIFLEGYILCFVGVQTYSGLNVKAAFSDVEELEERVGKWARAAISMTKQCEVVPEDNFELDDWRNLERIERMEKELQVYVKSDENTVRSSGNAVATREKFGSNVNSSIASHRNEDRKVFDVEEAVKAPRLFVDKRMRFLWNDSQNENAMREYVSENGNFCVRLGDGWTEEPEVRNHSDGSCVFRFAMSEDSQWFAVTHRKREGMPAITDLVRWALTMPDGNGLPLEFPNSATRASCEIVSFSNFPLLDRSFRDKHSVEDMSMHFATFRLKGKSHRAILVTLRRGDEDWKLELVSPIPDVGNSTNSLEGVSDSEVSTVAAIFGTFRTLDSVKCVFCGNPVYAANKKQLSVQLCKRKDFEHILKVTLNLPYCAACHKMKRKADVQANWKRLLVSLGIGLSIGGWFSLGVVKGDTQDLIKMFLMISGFVSVFVGILACLIISPSYKRKIIKHPTIQKFLDDGFGLGTDFKTVK